MVNDYRTDLIFYRTDRARECLFDTEKCLESNSLYAAANRLYYGVFNTMRVLLAYDNVNFSKHSGVISYVRSQYIKTDILEVKFSELIRNVESLRSDCDYKDFYVPVKEELEKQLELAKEFIDRVESIVKTQLGE